MRFINVQEQFEIVPNDFATQEAILRECKYTRDKVSQMEKNGDVIRLKKV